MIIKKSVGIELVDSGFEGTAWHLSQNSRCDSNNKRDTLITVGSSIRKIHFFCK